MNPKTSSPDDLDTLLKMLQDSIGIFRSELQETGLPPLCINKEHPLDASDSLPSPRLYESKRVILSTLALLTNLFQSPFDKLVDLTYKCMETASLHTIIHLDIPSLLLPSVSQSHSHSHSEGRSIEEIANIVDVHPAKVQSTMRLLANDGWFEEVREGVFTDTKFTKILQNGGDELCWPKAVELTFKCSTGLAEAVEKPEWRHSRSSLHSGFQISHQTTKQVFEYIHSDEKISGMFTRGMHALDRYNMMAVLHDYPWGDVPNGTTIVDVGGGQGGLCIELAKRYPNLKFIVQDLPHTSQLANTHFEEVMPDAFKSGRLGAEARDFFKEEELKGDSYWYFLKWILHDWPEEECITILKNLAEAAGPQSRIIAVDHILSPMIFNSQGPTVTEAFESIPVGNSYVPIPDPRGVPLGFGHAGKLPLQISVAMTSAFNASERTLTEFQAIFQKAGVELVKVYPMRSWVSAMELRKI